MATSSIYDHNSSVAPQFVAEGSNFSLSTNDVAARNNGMDLSDIFDFDILNRPRDDGLWDRGAFEGASTSGPGGAGTNSPTGGLLTWLNFEDTFTDGRLDDASGHGNHAIPIRAARLSLPR